MLSREVLFRLCRSALRMPPLTSTSAARCLHSSSVALRKRNLITRIRTVASGVSKPSGGDKRIHASLNEDKRAKWAEAMEKEKSLSDRLPEDNVFFAPYYAPQHLSVAEAVEVFREMAAPEMLDHQDGELHVNVQMSMRTSKKTKFLSGISTTVKVPHRPTFLRPRKIIVFTGNPAEAEAAKAAGALDAGAETLVAHIEHGYYHWEAFDNVICHSDFIAKITPVRRLLRDRYPAGSRVGTNVLEMLELHSQGILISSTKDAVIPEVAHVALPLGRLSDPTEQIEANLQTYVDCIHSQRSSRIVGQFIEKMELTAPPSPLSLRLELYPEPEPVKPQKKPKKAAKEVSVEPGPKEDTGDTEVTKE